MAEGSGFRAYTEKEVAGGLQWMCFLLSLLLFSFYAYQYKRKTCGWEVIYIAYIESIKYILEIWFEESSPATIRLTNGTVAPWLRYAEWLLTCPVILIALSRVGMAGEGSYSRRTMKLLTSDQGTIIMGVTAAYSKGAIKVCFFFVGLLYGFNTFYTAATVYLEAFRSVDDDLKGLVKYMTYCFYSSWCMFPILFVAGPEGFGHISPAGSIIGHSIADLLSKNLWGIFDWWLDYQVTMRAMMRMQEEGDDDNDNEDKMSGAGSEALAPAPFTASVILGDPQGSLVPYYTKAFSKLPAKLTVVSSMESLLSELEDMKAARQRVDMCLVAPTLLEDEAFDRLRAEHSVKIVVYVEGLAGIPEESLAPFRERCDDFIEAPARGVMVDESQLSQIFYRHAASLVGPTASLEAHMAAQTAILLQIQADIAKLSHNGGAMPSNTKGASLMAY
eukprot:CAMPEP_0197591930 /NCGR_PEP_ID=MMETSP1326-20131121/14094_1 /TAXON_ID=1155430 /ORGANISM="Genus nov. species nov., Strain RCC2288" /LENGTH=445 /DNA_ID=CAMNT_0043157513 /DNA_START=176 /DNA_END=1513 /DNA_ORIENTATION=-